MLKTIGERLMHPLARRTIKMQKEVIKDYESLLLRQRKVIEILQKIVDNYEGNL